MAVYFEVWSLEFYSINTSIRDFKLWKILSSLRTHVSIQNFSYLHIKCNRLQRLQFFQ